MRQRMRLLLLLLLPHLNWGLAPVLLPSQSQESNACTLCSLTHSDTSTHSPIEISQTTFLHFEITNTQIALHALSKGLLKRSLHAQTFTFYSLQEIYKLNFGSSLFFIRKVTSPHQQNQNRIYCQGGFTHTRKISNKYEIDVYSTRYVLLFQAGWLS